MKHLSKAMACDAFGERRFKWRAQGDDFRTFLSDLVAVLPQIELPAGLSL
jgi:hypothetical protein